jgi:hypothetical protein
MRQHDGRDLRVFARDDLRHGLGFHPLQRFDSLTRLAIGYPVEQQVRLLLAHRLGQHPAHIVLGSAGDVRLAVRDADELIQHRAHLLARNFPKLSHCNAQFLHFAGVQLLEHVGGILLTQAHQQNCGALGAGQFI